MDAGTNKSIYEACVVVAQQQTKKVKHALVTEGLLRFDSLSNKPLL